MKVDAPLLTGNLSEIAPDTRRIERLGYDGAFTFEGPHDPFLPLALAAEHSSRLELATAIAIAFPRSPMQLAHTAHDLQVSSGGRFILGLGSQVRAHIEKRYGALDPLIASDPDMRSLVTQIMKADIEMLEAYSYRDEEPLDVPILALGGRNDASTPPEELEPWRVHTTSSFGTRLFDGGHFFLRDRRAELLGVVEEVISGT